MTLFLLMLLAAIALFITLIGYFLTPKSQTRSQRTMYRADYPVYRSSRRIREPFNEPLRMRRAMAYTEQQSTWIDFWQSLLISRIFGRRAGQPTSWMGMTLILLSVSLFCIFLLKSLMPNAALIAAFTGTSPARPASSSNPAPQGPFTASKNLVRLSQLDPAQYNSNNDYNVWAYSACSTAAMTEVLDAYGRHFRIADILKVEAAIGEITPQEGLLEDAGIAHTVAHFGFNTEWGHNRSLNDIINIANGGRPVIVSFPPDRYDGGHLVVVTGGNSQYVYLADSSIFNRHSLTRSKFLSWWEGFYAIVTPK